jgi:hypothetical protein
MKYRSVLNKNYGKIAARSFEKFEQDGQGQVFRFWDRLDDNERFRLCHQTLRTWDMGHRVTDFKL